MGGGAATEEPGAQDNRLSIDPNDPNFECLKDVEDGASVNIMIKATQSSPGEFVVNSAESCEANDGADAEGATEDEGEMGSMGKAKDKYPNPAVAKMAMKE